MNNVDIKKFIKWTILNGLIFAALIYGLVYGHEPVFNIVKFVIWINFACIIILILGYNSIKEELRKKEKSVPTWLNALYGSAFCLVLVWFGFFGYAAVEAFSTFAQCAIFDDKKTEE